MIILLYTAWVEMTVSSNFSDVIISEADSERVSIVCFILSFVENEDLGQIPL